MWRCVTRTCSGNIVVQITSYSSREEGDPGYYTVLSLLKQHDHISTCTPPQSTRVARSSVIRSSPSLTSRVAAELVGILNRSRKRGMNSEAEQASSTVKN